ncbi:hypothetical protein Aperf_G00000019327 [Anoplocephala perfoliata]
MQVDGKPFDAIKMKSVTELPNLELDPRELTLKLCNETTCFVSTEGLCDFIRLRNPLNVPIAFKWTPQAPNKDMQIYPEAGVVLADTSQDCEVIYRYSFKKESFLPEKFIFGLSTFTEGSIPLVGLESQLDVRIHLPQPKLITCSKRIKLGDVPWGLEIQRCFSLRNVGNGPAFATIYALGGMNEVQMGFEKCPKEIRSGEEVTFKVTCYCRKVGYFEVPISIQHSGKEIMQMSAQGTCIFPKIEVTPAVVHFKSEDCNAKGIFVRQKAFAKVIVKNTSAVPARVEFDFGDYGDFHAEELKGKLLTPLSSNNCVLLFEPKNNLVPPPLLWASSPEVSCRTTSFTNSSSSFGVYFGPTSSNHRPAQESTLTKDPVLSLLSNRVHDIQNVKIENCTNCTLHWKIDISNLPTTIPITLSRIDGVFQNFGDSADIEIRLKPESSSCQIVNLPIVVEGDVSQSEASYLTIQIEPLEIKLICCPSHIFLPPLPTSETFTIDVVLTLNLLEGDFMLENIAFVTWKSLGIAELPFSVTLPDGKKFTRKAGAQKLRVKVQIHSRHPFAISNRPQPPSLIFTARSSNSDFENRVYSCCMPFIISFDESLLSLVHFNQLADKHLSNISSLLDYHQTFDDRTSTVIESWLRHHGFPGVVYGLSFPSDFQRSLSLQDIILEAGLQRKEQFVHSLGVLVECLAHLAGIWNPPGIPRSLTLPIQDTPCCIGMLYNHLAALICFAESQGGCVGHIAPEYLMTYNDYMTWVRNCRPGGPEASFMINIPDGLLTDFTSIVPTVISPCADGNVKLQYPPSEILDKIAFERVSRIAWMDLFLQMFKTLEVGQGAESRLLRWVNKSVKNIWKQLCEENKQTEKPTQYQFQRPVATNFREDFSNGLVLASLIASHAPIMIPEILSKINLCPQSQEQILHNAIQIIRAIQILQMDVAVTVEDISNPKEIQIILILSKLYRTLPEYRIRCEVEFKGPLQSYVVEDLILSNPTNQKLIYQCFYVGPDAERFYFNKEPNKKHTCKIELGGNKKSTLKTGYFVETTSESEACLVMVPRKNASVAKGPAMTSFDIETSCYEPIVKLLSISNPLSQGGLFRIQLVKSNVGSSDGIPERFRGFSCRTTEVMLSNEGETRVEIAFHPMSVGEYSEKLVFSNPTLGDFAIELCGHSHSPKDGNLTKGGNYSFSCSLGNEQSLNLQIPSKNELKLAAMKWIAEYHFSSQEPDHDGSSVPELLISHQMNPPSNKMRKTRFTVECNSEIFKLPNFIDVQIEKEQAGAAENIVMKEFPLVDFFDLPLRIFCCEQGIHRAILILSAPDDVRVFTLECKASADVPPSITHEDTLENISERFFADPAVFVTDDLDKLQQKEVSLDGRTSVMVTYCGKVEIKCQVGNCKHKTDKLGRHIATILLPKNKTEDPQKFTVERDVPSYVVLSDSVIVAQPNSRGRVSLLIPIKKRVDTFGWILFTKSNFDISSNSAPPVEHHEFECRCLEVNEISLPLQLPIAGIRGDRSYQVFLKGSDITGPDIVEGASSYLFEYRPVSIGKKKISVIFFNEDSGEFWFDMDLLALPPSPKTAPHWSCELGESCVNTVEIENPAAKSYSLSVEIVNTDVYEVVSYYLKGASDVTAFNGEPMALPDLRTLCLIVRFRPQEYGEWLNDGKILLFCEELGEIRIHLSGEGTLPTMKDEVSVEAEYGRCEMITKHFMNPLPYPVDVFCLIKSDESEDQSESAYNAFEIVGTRKKALHDGENWKAQEIVWPTLLKGTPKMYGATLEELQLGRQRPCQQSRPQEPLLIEGVVGTLTVIKLHFNLPCFVEGPNEDMRFQWKFSINHCYGDHFLDAKFVVQKAIELSQSGYDFVGPSKTVPRVELSGVYKPTRSFNISALLCIVSKAGGVWQFPVTLKANQSQKLVRRLHFISQDPQIADCSKLHLDSRESNPAEFRAFFSKSTSEEFSLDASRGLLPSRGTGYFTLTIKFTKRIYGRTARGQLVVQVPSACFVVYVVNFGSY